MIGLDRIEPLILKRIGAHLVGEADAAPFLIEIEQNARALGAHLGQCAAQLGAAVAFETAKEVAGETGRVQPRQHRRRTIGAADFDGVMFLGAVIRAENVQATCL